MNRSIRGVLPVLGALAFAALPLAAQSYATDQGSYRVGGDASFSSSGFDTNGSDFDERVTAIQIRPALQYFFIPGLALGGNLTLAYTSLDDDSEWVYGIGPAATYYFGRGERSAYPYLGAALQFLWENPDSDGPDEDEDDPVTTGYRGAAGVLFMLASAVGVSAELYYEKVERDVGNFEFGTDSYGLAVGISAFVF